jgi:E3 ubiquitin-protein ligase HERC1
VLELYRVDRDTANLLLRVRHNNDPSCPGLSPDDFDALYGCFSFVYHRSDGTVAPLKPGGAEQWLSYATRHEWCDLVEELRRCECAPQLGAVRRGLAAVVPAAALAVFTAAELERMCCGEADWTVAFLQTNSEVKLPAADPRAAFLWAALEGFTREERGLFLQFVWGRSRMPQGGGRLSQRFVVSDLGRQEGDANTRLPTASTCFFDLHLPRYTNAEALAERLKYAIYNCRGIDLDYVAHDTAAWGER